MSDLDVKGLEILRSESPRRWVVASHMNPDGDTLGSAIAMKVLLRNLGHEVLHVCPDPVPRSLAFLPGADEVVQTIPEDWQRAAGVVTLDAADLGRFGPLSAQLGAMHPLVDVDHHISNPLFGDVNVVLTDAAATGEVVYRLFRHFEVPVDAEAAHGMYVALVTDTGRFAYEATHVGSHEMAAELLRAGVQPGHVYRMLYERVELAEVRIRGLAMQGMQLSPCGRVAWTTISQDMLAGVGAREEQTEGLVETLRTIEGVEVSIMVRETARGTLKASLRSKQFVDVAALAARFQGGGHRRAAGCTLTGNLEQAAGRLVMAALEALSALEPLRA
jgi:phosphoesterase RecJ-like protein